MGVLARQDRGARRRNASVLAGAVLAASLAGCAAIIPQTPNAIFDLRAPGHVAPPRGSLQILVPPPTMLKALDTDRIAARPNPAQYAYLPGAVWSDQLPRLLQARLMQTLQNSGRVRAAALPGQGLLIDYQIVVDVRAFELTDEGAVADFAVKLMDDKNGHVLRSKVFRHVAAIRSNDTASIVAGLNTAMAADFVDITRWAFTGA